MVVRALAVVVAVWLSAVPTVGAQPDQDSVTGSGTTANNFTFDIEARSGPSGENPTGQVSFTWRQGVLFAGRVSCLVVNGNVATLNVEVTPPLQFGPLITMDVTDSPTGDLIRAIPTARSPDDCSPLTSGVVEFPVSSGDVVVVDAQPFPTSKEQCKNGGWQSYGVFSNQGDCVSFVATGGKNQPSGH